jgi:hypothetical protein
MLHGKNSGKLTTILITELTNTKGYKSRSSELLALTFPFSLAKRLRLGCSSVKGFSH